MTKAKILEMLNKGQIEELKKILAEEIYEDELKKAGKQDAVKRFAAMKRWMKYARQDIKMFAYPAKNVSVNIAGETKVMNCFTNPVSVVLTKESIGSLPDFDSMVENEEYFNIGKAFEGMSGTPEEVDLNALFVKAKVEGYKFKKSEVDIFNFKYVLKYKDLYVKFAYVDNVFGIINDGEKAKVYYIAYDQPLFIETSIGYAFVLPLFWENVPGQLGKIVIEMESGE